MGPGSDISRATMADVPDLARLGRATFIEAFGHNYLPEDLEEFLAGAHSEAAYARLVADEKIAAWLASDDGTAVGYVVAGPCKLPVAGLEPGAGEVRQLYVLTTAQNRQLGTRLLVTALDWLAARGHHPLYVGVWSQNPGAQRLYARFGFDKVGEYDFPVGRHIDREFILKRR